MGGGRGAKIADTTCLVKSPVTWVLAEVSLEYRRYSDVSRGCRGDCKRLVIKISIIGSGRPVSKMACITLFYILYDNVPPFHSSSSSNSGSSLLSCLTEIPFINQYSFIPPFRVL